MKLRSMLVPPLPILVALAVLAMLGLQGLVEYRLLASRAVDVGQLTQAIRQLHHPGVAEAPSPSKTKKQLDGLLTRLAKQESNAARIERLHQLAQVHGVVLRKASYRNQTMSGEISRHEIQADLVGAYPAIRQFLRVCLAQDEAAALESLEFSRPAGGASVQAQVRLALYSRRLSP